METSCGNCLFYNNKEGHCNNLESSRIKGHEVAKEDSCSHFDAKKGCIEVLVQRAKGKSCECIVRTSRYAAGGNYEGYCADKDGGYPDECKMSGVYDDEEGIRDDEMREVKERGVVLQGLLKKLDTDSSAVKEMRIEELLNEYERLCIEFGKMGDHGLKPEILKRWFYVRAEMVMRFVRKGVE